MAWTWNQSKVCVKHIDPEDVKRWFFAIPETCSPKPNQETARTGGRKLSQQDERIKRNKRIESIRKKVKICMRML